MSEQPTFYGQGDPLMEAMFGSCVRWAWRDSETRAAFVRETGMKFAENTMDALVDEATGYDREVADAFVRWVIANVWGRGNK